MPETEPQQVIWALFDDAVPTDGGPVQLMLRAGDCGRHRFVPNADAPGSVTGAIAIGPRGARRAAGLAHRKRFPMMIFVDPVTGDDASLNRFARRRADAVICTSTQSLTRCHRAGYPPHRCVLVSSPPDRDRSPWAQPASDPILLTSAAPLRRRADVRMMLELADKVGGISTEQLRFLLPVEPGFNDCLEIAAASERVIAGDVLPSFPTSPDRCIVIGLGPPQSRHGAQEALDAGQVVVTLSGAPGDELIEHGENGFRAGSIDELAATVKSLVQQPGTGEAVAECALRSSSNDEESGAALEPLLDRAAAVGTTGLDSIEHELAAARSRSGHPSPNDIIGVPVHDVTMDEAVALVERYIREPGHYQIATPNINFIMRAFRDGSFRALLSRTALNIPDGAWILWIARALGGQIREQVAGRILAVRIIERAAELGWRVFFLGAAPGVGERAALAMADRYPGLQVAGVLSPMYNPERPSDEDDAAVDAIRASKADVVLVAYGMPKQDIWGDRYLERSGASVCIGIGGTFDMMAGDYKTAPDWIRGLGLEFAWRTLQEPRRLFLRYARDAVVFRHVAAQRSRPPVRSLGDEPTISPEHDRRSDS